MGVACWQACKGSRFVQIIAELHQSSPTFTNLGPSFMHRRSGAHSVSAVLENPTGRTTRIWGNHYSITPVDDGVGSGERDPDETPVSAKACLPHT
jgi:hypothetical protein